MPFLKKNLGRPDEVRTFANGQTEVFQLGDTVVGRSVFEPGWRWSTDVRPIVETESCEVHHQGLVISGRLHVVMSDGPEMEIGPGDLFEIPPGHDAWTVGDEPWVSVDFSGRRYFAAAPSAGRRGVATVLFTDIVDSTLKAATMGDAAWRGLIAEHNERARARLDRHRGREIKTTGDGMLVVFDSPTEGVRAAAGILEAVASLGLELRAGLHSGEVEITGNDVRGIAVHTAARVMAEAGPGEVLVSRTTHDLVGGSGLAFASRGSKTLKGLAEPVDLYALVSTDVGRRPDRGSLAPRSGTEKHDVVDASPEDESVHDPDAAAARNEEAENG